METIDSLDQLAQLLDKKIVVQINGRQFPVSGKTEIQGDTLVLFAKNDDKFVIVRNSDLCFVSSWTAFNYEHPEALNGRMFAFDSRQIHAHKFEQEEIQETLQHLRKLYPNDQFSIIQKTDTY